MSPGSRWSAVRANDSPSFVSSAGEGGRNVEQQRHERPARVVERVEDAAPHAVALDEAGARQDVEVGRHRARRVAQAPGEARRRRRAIEGAQDRGATVAEQELETFVARDGASARADAALRGPRRGPRAPSRVRGRAARPRGPPAAAASRRRAPPPSRSAVRRRGDRASLRVGSGTRPTAVVGSRATTRRCARARSCGRWPGRARSRRRGSAAAPRGRLWLVQHEQAGDELPQRAHGQPRAREILVGELDADHVDRNVAAAAWPGERFAGDRIGRVA
jgi:hypothetical protein